MKTLNNTSIQVVDALNQLLADHQVYYQNLRGLHWNVKGTLFFALHTQFESYYNQASETVDELAERILMLGGQPFHTMNEFLAHAGLTENSSISDGKKAVELVLKDSEYLLTGVKSALLQAAEVSDEGTQAMLSEMVSGYEKQIWMLKAFLG